MHRDMELIRKILLDVESWPAEGGDRQFQTLGGPSPEIEYNCYQAVRAGLLVGIWDDTDCLICTVFGLTPSGHDFLDQARNEYVWNEAQNYIKDKGFGGATLKMLSKALEALAKKHLGLD